MRVFLQIWRCRAVGTLVGGRRGFYEILLFRGYTNPANTL